MSRQKILAVATAFALAGTSTGVAHADTGDCTDLRNGRLCISITPLHQNGKVVVSYRKNAGGSFTGHLEWENPAGQVFKSPDVQMVAGRFYSHTWPTWVGPGRNRGIVYNKSDKESSYTPWVYPR